MDLGGFLIGGPEEGSQMAMRSRRVSRATRCMAGALLAATSFGLLTGAVRAQDSIEDARQDRADARSEAAAAAAELAAAKADDAEVAAALAAITAEVNAQQARLDEANRQLVLTTAELVLARDAITQSEAEEALLRQRLIKSSVSSFVGAGDVKGSFLQVEDLGRSLRQETLLGEVTGDTTELIEELHRVSEDRVIATAEASDALLEATRIEDELAVVVTELEADQVVQAALKAEMESRVQRWRTELANAEAEEAKLSAFIRAEEAKAAAPAPGPAPSAGEPSAQGFQWPLSAPVTSNYGWRVHPIHGTRRLHAGIDLGAGSGTSIAAAKGGTVITAGWLGGYGNTVIISHGGGLTTLYAHQSKLAVSVGQSVGRGERIGYVGSTGQSTGPHLHFEVRVNGSPVNPRPYLP